MKFKGFNISKKIWRYILATLALGMICIYGIAATEPNINFPEVGLPETDLSWAKVMSALVLAYLIFKEIKPLILKTNDDRVRQQARADIEMFNSSVSGILQALGKDRETQQKIAESLTIQADSVNRLVHIIEEQRVVSIGMDKDIDLVLEMAKGANDRIIKIQDDVHTIKGIAIDGLKKKG